MSIPGERGRLARIVATPAAAFFGLLGSGQTNLQQTNAILWVMLGISVAGTILTFGFLVYSVVKFRDRSTRRRRYG